MSETKHTPEPWKVEYFESHDHRVAHGIYGPESEQWARPIALVTQARAQHEANARLMAAAPEMLQMLKDVRRIEHGCLCGDDGNHAVLCVNLDRLIAKAEGK